MNCSHNQRLLTEVSEFHNNPELLHIIKDTLLWHITSNTGSQHLMKHHSQGKTQNV
jgi:hypothetical protein